MFTGALFSPFLLVKPWASTFLPGCNSAPCTPNCRPQSGFFIQLVKL